MGKETPALESRVSGAGLGESSLVRFGGVLRGSLPDLLTGEFEDKSFVDIPPGSERLHHQTIPLDHVNQTVTADPETSKTGEVIFKRLAGLRVLFDLIHNTSHLALQIGRKMTELTLQLNGNLPRIIQSFPQKSSSSSSLVRYVL